MGRKNRNRQNQFNRQQQQGGTAMQSRPQQHQQQQRNAGPADADIALSIASLGQRIDQLKARWADTQTRIEALRQTSREVLAEHNVAMAIAVDGGDGAIDEVTATEDEAANRAEQPSPITPEA